MSRHSDDNDWNKGKNMMCCMGSFCCLFRWSSVFYAKIAWTFLDNCLWILSTGTNRSEYGKGTLAVHVVILRCLFFFAGMFNPSNLWEFLHFCRSGLDAFGQHKTRQLQKPGKIPGNILPAINDSRYSNINHCWIIKGEFAGTFMSPAWVCSLGCTNMESHSSRRRRLLAKHLAYSKQMMIEARVKNNSEH